MITETAPPGPGEISDHSLPCPPQAHPSLSPSHLSPCQPTGTINFLLYLRRESLPSRKPVRLTGEDSEDSPGGVKAGSREPGGTLRHPSP